MTVTVTEYDIRRYRQTLFLGIIEIVKELFPGEKLKILHSILDGIYCELTDSVLSSREVQKTEEHLRSWVLADQPISYRIGDNNLYYCRVGEEEITTLYPPLERSGLIKHFKLIHFLPGFILIFPNVNHPNSLSPFIPPEKLSATFSETKHWLENLNFSTVQDVNAVIDSDSPQELISLAEALHEKQISLIADQIFAQRRNVRVVLISGPSSSGKTTFAQRLSTQLMVSGLRPVALSLDNYFLPRVQTPLDASGQYDFECLEALDLPLLATQLKALVDGYQVETPVYDFVSGERSSMSIPMKLSSDEILIVEGIHALNPYLLPSLDRHQLFKIYISDLFQLNIDSYTRVSTTEVRLIRRLVRDVKYRGTKPERTLELWASVRRGEIKNIFPFQEEADVMFNSSLLYELNALRPLAEKLLASVNPESPHQPMVTHLLTLLSFFRPIENAAAVPLNSILREFIGGSIYEE